MTARRNLFDRRAFGRAVRRRWLERDIGVRAAAKEAGVSAATFSRVSRGHGPTVEIYMRLLAWIEKP